MTGPHFLRTFAALKYLLGMKLKLLALTVFTALMAGCTQQIPEDAPSLIDLRYEQNESVTYREAVEMYERLAAHYPEAKLMEYGKTDVGKPLHLFVMDNSRNFDPESARKKDKRIVMIMNGIHPGEPAGIDASLMFADDVLRNKEGMRQLLDSTVICIIPVYNIGGMLNRSAFHRTGHITPKEAGHRGNAKNLDLNRDFAKMDTRNAWAFANIFREWQPEVFLDTHTTNGTDHPYPITLIPYQSDAMPEPLGTFFRETMMPCLYDQMEQSGFEMIPYVNWYNVNPKSGIRLNAQTPRFSTGYTGLFNTMCFMTENQIYADFPDRVKSSYHFMYALTSFTNANATEIKRLRAEADEITRQQKVYTLQWETDTTRFQNMHYKGFEGEMGISPVTGLERFSFNREKPYDTIIRYYNRHIAAKTIEAPAYYILPQAWQEVAERLAQNAVEMLRFTKDTVMRAERYMIDEVKTSERPSNGHHFHYDVSVAGRSEEVQIYQGDILIPLNQSSNKYIVEMLEPEAQDSFFRWNFFDPILDQREYYSSYGFEENALRYLNENPDFRKEWEKAIRNDPALQNDHRAQLGYIYDKTEWADNVTRRYPVLRVNDKTNLPVR
jgi:hypothetical protein